jgi:hypothetical protein
MCFEDVVTSQPREAGMTLALVTREDQRGDGLWVIPPDFLGNGAEELEGSDHPFQDCLGALERQCQDERGIRVGPGRDQERYESTTLGEINVDVSEIGFEALAREMSQWNERFLMPTSVLAADIAAPERSRRRSGVRRGGVGRPEQRCAVAWAERFRRRPRSGR